MEATKLRHSVWEQRMKIMKFKSRRGEVEMCLQKLENLEAEVGVAEYELQVPGALLNQEAVVIADQDPSSLDYESILGVEEVNLDGWRMQSSYFSIPSLWADAISSKKPLVMEEEESVVDARKQKIVSMLVESGNTEVSVVPIIGMPGTGKTTLSQRVYHDSRVREYFKVRHWVSMSDIREGPNKLLNLVFRHKTHDPDILNEFHANVDGKRYLLIVDDVTHMDCGEFLLKLLSNVSPGSKVILTASDMTTLGNMEPLQLAKGAPYELRCLSQDEAWSVFKNIALNDGAKKDYPDNWSDIGFKICSKYASLPRVLENLAMILQSREDWEYIHDKLLNSIEDPLESCFSKVHLSSYKKLSWNIQQCVKYCSLFPVDFKLIKKDLLHLWDAQDFLSPTETKPEVLDGNEDFEELLNSRYLFEDNENSSSGNVTINYKMDSFVNEFLKSVAKPKFCLVDEGTGVDNQANILHVSFPVIKSSWVAPSWLLDAKQLKSLLFLPCKPGIVGKLGHNIDEVLSSLRQLRALDLAAVNYEGQPKSLGELTDLRYLRLGASSKYLPESITGLRNLQTLDLRHSSVTFLPRDFHRLGGLKHLYTGDRLMEMPPDFGKLTSIQTLDVFIVGDNNSIDELSKLTELVGKLKVRYKNHDAIKQKPKRSDGIFKHTHLTDISLIWSSSYGRTNADAFECLEPPPSLKSLSLRGWKGVSFPQQLRVGFRSLVSLHIEDCNRCESLPDFSTLPNLRSLQLWDLNNLERIEIAVNNTSTAYFFPSLKSLMLANLLKLERWSPEQDGNYIFPSLLEFRVSGCKKLISMPQMQKLESLEAHDVQGVLLQCILSSQLVSSSTTSTLKTLIIVSIHELDSLSTKSGLESLKIMRCSELQTLHVGHLPSNVSYLKRLEVHECGKLKYITTDSTVEHLILEKLTLKCCEALHWWGMNQDGNHDEEINASLIGHVAWEKLKFLQSLKLINIFTLETLPTDLICLERLEELSLHSLGKLRSLPEWIGNISQLRRLAIQNCSLLTALPESLGKLSHLEELQIHNCFRLKEIPESIESSCALDIKGCPKLQRRHQQDDGQN